MGTYRTPGRPASQTAKTAPPLAMDPRVEVFHDRDPDSCCSITILVDGEVVHQFAEYNLDASAGHTWHDWIDSAAYSIATASAAAAAMIWESAIDPAGGQYICDMPEQRIDRDRQLKKMVSHYRSQPGTARR
ncbi:Uncharacterised protein [Mycobacteroides abscessus subsp. abscessus]|nr:Uncharacterised protein [Mycobacteroides abscessus subsp. abscessus]